MHPATATGLLVPLTNLGPALKDVGTNIARTDIAEDTKQTHTPKAILTHVAIYTSS